MTKAYFNWSTGKDSAMALHRMLQNPDYEVLELLTSINAHFNRVTMHGVRRSLLEAQIKSIGIPASTIELPENPSMEEYGKLMKDGVAKLKAKGLTTAGFGDIFLEDLRQYREDQLATEGIDCHFPLWKENTTDLIKEFIDLGFKSIVVSCNGDLLNESFVGRVIDHQFIADLPENVDPCGENGEFHTFCFDGPIFKEPINFTIGSKEKKSYPRPNAAENEKQTIDFWFCDLIPE